jgi:hypothetical protein
MRTDSQNKLHLVDVRELPQLVQLTNAKGIKVLYQLVASRDRLGMCLNRVSKAISEKLSRRQSVK